MKNQTELIRTFEAKRWHYDKAERGHVRIWSQLVKKMGISRSRVNGSLIWWSISYFTIILRYTFEQPTKWYIRMTQLKFRNMRISGCNSPNLVHNPMGTWVNFLWPIPIIFNQCLNKIASKLLKYRFYTLKMQDITFKEVFNAYWHFLKISL